MTFGGDLLGTTGRMSGSGDATQMRNTTQGVRYKKSIALPRCISGPIRQRYLSRCPTPGP
jgi:hypothetical protein